MTAKTITDMIYDITELTTDDVQKSVLTDTYIQMAVRKITSLVPDFPYSVVEDTTGDVLIDNIIAEWSTCFLLRKKGFTAYDPNTGEVIEFHCDTARSLLLDEFGIMTEDGKKFPSEVSDMRAYGGGIKVNMVR